MQQYITICNVDGTPTICTKGGKVIIHHEPWGQAAWTQAVLPEGYDESKLIPYADIIAAAELAIRESGD